MNTIQNSYPKISQDIELTVNSLEEEEDVCPICLCGDENGPLIEVAHKTNDYLHTFHRHCINKWTSEGHQNCPICREPMKLRNCISITPTKMLTTTVSAFYLCFSAWFLHIIDS